MAAVARGDDEDGVKVAGEDVLLLLLEAVKVVAADAVVMPVGLFPRSIGMQGLVDVVLVVTLLPRPLLPMIYCSVAARRWSEEERCSVADAAAREKNTRKGLVS